MNGLSCLPTACSIDPPNDPRAGHSPAYAADKNSPSKLTPFPVLCRHFCALASMYNLLLCSGFQTVAATGLQTWHSAIPAATNPGAAVTNASCSPSNDINMLRNHPNLTHIFRSQLFSSAGTSARRAQNEPPTSKTRAFPVAGGPDQNPAQEAKSRNKRFARPPVSSCILICCRRNATMFCRRFTSRNSNRVRLTHGTATGACVRRWSCNRGVVAYYCRRRDRANTPAWKA